MLFLVTNIFCPLGNHLVLFLCKARLCSGSSLWLGQNQLIHFRWACPGGRNWPDMTGFHKESLHMNGASNLLLSKVCAEMLHAALRGRMAPVQTAQLCLWQKGEGSRLSGQHHGQQTEGKRNMRDRCQASVPGIRMEEKRSAAHQSRCMVVWAASAPNLRHHPVKLPCWHSLPWGSGLYLHFFSPKSIKSEISNAISCEAPAINISDVCRKVLQAPSWSCMLQDTLIFPT